MTVNEDKKFDIAPMTFIILFHIANDIVSGAIIFFMLIGSIFAGLSENIDPISMTYTDTIIVSLVLNIVSIISTLIAAFINKALFICLFVISVSIILFMSVVFYSF